MGKYILKRIGLMVLTLWAVATITFFLMRAIPGDPLSSDRKMPAEVKKNIEKKYNLDKPVMTQYVYYLRDLSKGDLGLSMRYRNRSVNDMLANGFPASAKLGFSAMAIGIFLGISMGIIAAINNKGFFDYFVIIIAVMGISVPNFVFGSIFQYFFAVELRWLPVAGWKGAEYMILPIMALAFRYIAYQARMMKTSMIEVMGADYVVTAKAKGLSKTTVTLKHVLRNASLPLITTFGPLLSTAVLGSFVIEKIFGVPGVGRFFVMSIQQYDYTTLLGTTLAASSLVVVGYFISDILYGVVDPRIRVGKK